MINIQESLETVQADIEIAFNAIQSLTDAEQGLLSYTSHQKALTLEKKSQGYAIENLRDEKQQLKLEVEKMKSDLFDLKIELTETQNEVLNQTYTTKAPSIPVIGEIERNEDKQVMHIDASSEESTNRSTAFVSNLDMCATSLPRQLTFGNENMSFQCGEEEHYIDSFEEVSTTSVQNILKKVSTSPRKQYHAKKVYWSPKKWRRMVRTHRLQSIFVNKMN